MVTTASAPTLSYRTTSDSLPLIAFSLPRSRRAPPPTRPPRCDDGWPHSPTPQRAPTRAWQTDGGRTRWYTPSHRGTAASPSRPRSRPATPPSSPSIPPLLLTRLAQPARGRRGGPVVRRTRSPAVHWRDDA